MNVRTLAKRMRKVEADASARNAVHVWADANDTAEMVEASIQEACDERGLDHDRALPTVLRWGASAPNTLRAGWEPRAARRARLQGEATGRDGRPLPSRVEEWDPFGR